MSAPLRFDGKVVLVTGAGNGLGKEYALAFAERGASVVVNDLGGNFRGEGRASAAADAVVEEIKSKGGKAVANYDSVEEGEKLVQTALENFGRIDVIVNNAGILRDRSFARISDQDWDLIHRVHLRGSFQVTRAAWPHMKKNNYGRIIMVTSSAGIYGNFGQANYSSAKLGIYGLANTLAIEGKKNNIYCNTIAPVAGSRLTETVMPPDVVNILKPEYVAPLVLYLCHESCEDTGGLFEVGGGWIAKLRWERTEGAICRKAGKKMTPEEVRDNWEKVTDFTDSTYPVSTGESTMLMMNVVKKLDSEVQPNQTSGGSGGVDVEAARRQKPLPSTYTYTDRDVILYNLGVGSSTEHEEHLKFLFEGSEDFCVIPSFGVIPAFSSMSIATNVPGLEVDPTKILHGEQYLEIYKPFPPRGATLKSYARIVDVLDKGSGAVIIANVETFDEQNETVCFNQFSTFVVGAGNFGGKRTSSEAKPTMNPPKRQPDASISEKTGRDQAALYRLSGDRNPLHIDPSFAAMGGFAEPILHGLCSFGYATRHVIKQYCDNDVTKIKAIKVRFSRPVLPGQNIRTDMWKEGNRVYFQCKVVDNGYISLSGAYIDLHGSADTGVSAGPKVVSLMSDELFEGMAKRAESQPALAKKINAVFAFEITKDGKPAAKWSKEKLDQIKHPKTGGGPKPSTSAVEDTFLELNDGRPNVTGLSFGLDTDKGIAADMKTGGGVYRGDPKGVKADCTLIVDDKNMVDMASGKLNGQQAFMKGLLKIKGNMMLAQKLGDLLRDNSKM